jgi:hypothetical protein
MYGKLISSSPLFPLPLTPNPMLWDHQNLNILLITASNQFQNLFENVWEEFVGAIDAEDRTKDEGSRALRQWVVSGNSEGFFILSFSSRLYITM